MWLGIQAVHEADVVTAACSPEVLGFVVCQRYVVRLSEPFQSAHEAGGFDWSRCFGLDGAVAFGRNDRARGGADKVIMHECKRAYCNLN